MAVDPALLATYTSNVGASLKEDVSDIITNISPTEYPIQANIGSISVDNPEFFEWQLDTLNAARDNGEIDGFAFSALDNVLTTRTRLKAVCQIQARGFSVSDRQEEVSKYGLDSEISYQATLRGEELRRDCEKVITRPATPVDSADSTVPITAGIPSWLRTNTSRDGGGSDPGLTNGEPSSADPGDIDGTDRALSEADFLTVVGEIYDEGGNPDMVNVGRAVKQKWSQYMLSGNARSATQYQDQGRSPNSGIQVVGAVDYYVSDFGVLAIVPNRFSREDDVLILDTSLWELGTFRGYQLKENGRDGDKLDFFVVHDFCLISRNEAGSGVVADIDETTAMTA
jgi:hypothetical protein